MISRIRSRLTAVAGLVGLILLVVGLPLVLFRFGGSPLPGRLAAWPRILTVLSRRDDGAMLIGIVRACSWLAWLLFTACVMAEAQAAIRGRRAPRLRLAGMQGAAAYLVALATLAFTAQPAVTLAASVTAASQPAQPDTRTAHTVGARRLVTVRSGDCLWSLAQRYLGAGDRYREIARLNYGRVMHGSQVFRNPSLIEPGWQLLMPASTTVDLGEPRTTGGHHPGHPTADEHYGRRHSAAAPKHGAQANGRTDGETNQSGMTAGQAGSETSASAATGSLMPGAAFFIAGALAGAVLTSLGLLRRKQRQHRRRGRRIALSTDPEILRTEQRLRAAAPAEPVETLRDALACLEAGLGGAGHELPDIVGLHVSPDVLEVLLAAPAANAPPWPFMISPGRQGMCWQLDLPAMVTLPPIPGRTAAQPRLSALVCHLLPGLVTAGATSNGYLLLDLESMRVVGCDGPHKLIDQFITTVATELATGQWSGWYDLILVGCDELAGLGRAEHCPTLGEALDLLGARRGPVAHRIAERAPADVRELRLAEPDNEDWGLTILVSRAEPSAAQMTRLLQLAEDGAGGIAAVVAGDPESDDGRMAPAAMQLAPDPEQSDAIVANVVPLQIAVRPRALSAADYAAIGSLLATAAGLDDVSPQQEPYVVYGAPPWIAQGAELKPTDADSNASELVDTTGDEAPRRAASSGLEISILGPFAITGAAEQLQPKQAELILALALAAPAGLPNSALCSMLGADPDHAKPADALRQTITRTRRRLGLADNGQEYIIHAGNGQYVLHPDATLDWTRFRELVSAGRADDLRAAVSLIRGQPFTGSYFWWIDIPLAETVRAEVIDAAETLAEFELAVGSPRAAARAARAGLMADPSAEQLWRVMMRAEHAAGNIAGVAEAWRRCLAAIEDVAPDGEPHPDTAALYRRLTGSMRQQVEVR